MSNTADPFLTVCCTKCKGGLTCDLRFEYLCGHIICKTCDIGSGVCQYCGHPGPANKHSNEASSCSNDICEACEDTALYYCVICPKLLCDRCAHIHSVSPKRKNHKLVFLNDYPRQYSQFPEGHPVNYDIPENVYLPHKRLSDTSQQLSSKSRKSAAPLERCDNWNRTADFRKPFRKNPPVKQFSYSKSVSSRASSIHDMMDNLSNESCISTRTEKSVGTEISGSVSLIKNNHFTIMVYSNSNSSSVCSGPSSKVQKARTAGETPDPIIPACCASSTPFKSELQDDDEYHDHAVYIARKSSILSNGSTSSFTSHVCASHNSDLSRSLHPSHDTSKSDHDRADTMDNISDILNQSDTRCLSPGLLSLGTPDSRSPRLSIGIEPVGGCPMRDGYPNKSEVASTSGDDILYPQHHKNKRNQTNSPQSEDKPSSSSSNKEIQLIFDKENHDFIVHQSPAPSIPDYKNVDDLIDKYSTSSLKSNSMESQDLESSISSKVSVDDLLNKYDNHYRSQTNITAPGCIKSESECDLQASVSNISLPFGKKDDTPCMVPQKSTELNEDKCGDSPLMQRVRVRSNPNNDCFFDEKLLYGSQYNNDEVFTTNDIYLTHSEHYDSDEDREDLSEIAEENSMDAFSATEVSEHPLRQVSVSEIQDIIEETSFIEEIDEKTNRELLLEVESLSDENYDKQDLNIMVVEGNVRYKDAVPDYNLPTTVENYSDTISERSVRSSLSSVKKFGYVVDKDSRIEHKNLDYDHLEQDDDVRSERSIRSSASSIKRFGYAKSDAPSRVSRHNSVNSVSSEKNRSSSPIRYCCSKDNINNMPSFSDNIYKLQRSSSVSSEGSLKSHSSKASTLSKRSSVNPRPSSNASNGSKSSSFSNDTQKSNSSTISGDSRRCDSQFNGKQASEECKPDNLKRLEYPSQGYYHESSSVEFNPYLEEEIIGVDFTEGPAQAIKAQSISDKDSEKSSQLKGSNLRNSHGSTTETVPLDRSTGCVQIVFESDSECSGSLISDSSSMYKKYPEHYSDSEDSRNPTSTKRIILDRITSGRYYDKGENLGFMDNLSDQDCSLTQVSSCDNEDGKSTDEGEKAKDTTLDHVDVISELSVDENRLEPLSVTSVNSRIGKRVIIGREENGACDDDDTLYFPTMTEYITWVKNQNFSACSIDGDSEVGSHTFLEDLELSVDGGDDEADNNIEQEILCRYAQYKRQQSLTSVDMDFKGKKLEDILKLDEMSISSSKCGSEKGNIMDVISAENLTSSSTSTIIDEDIDLQKSSAPHSNSGNPPDYFDKEDSCSIVSREFDLPNHEINSSRLNKVNSEISISSSLYSAVSKDLGHYVEQFNDNMDQEKESNPSVGIKCDLFNRKYSKRVSALRPSKTAQTLPRSMNSVWDGNDIKQAYTLPRKRPQQEELTDFLNNTYAGRGPRAKSAESKMLYSRSFGSLFNSDNKKFPGEDNGRSLPRHLGRKPNLRCPSMRQVDWSIMGRKGTEPGYLMNPAGIAVDEGCVAISEEGNGRIQLFVEDESAYCINDMENPCGISISHNYIYVTDIDTNVVKIYGRDALERATLGGPGTQRGRFNEPRGIAYNETNGDLAVCDTENHRVQIFDVNCNFVTTIGVKGKNKGEFREPISCTYDRWGRLLVSDHCNYRVQIFDNNYQFITEFGKYGKGSGEFWGVNGICSHGNGDILVVDSDNNCLSVHSSDGRFISVFGRRGADRWEFLYPHSVATDTTGNVYVSDWGNHRIHIMDKKLLPYLELESHML